MTLMQGQEHINRTECFCIPDSTLLSYIIPKENDGKRRIDDLSVLWSSKNVQYNILLLVFGTGKDQVAKPMKEIMTNRPTNFNYIPQNKINSVLKNRKINFCEVFFFK